ncbi:type II toxin-antitoxin system Phd/YefM family antitoxin [Pseudoalteromonas sp. S201]|uniref:type II toxin-antitoxin system Phd/YefM family antitoxin n=1 Tax=Pseudoalteromonas sp. S201 TaxID=579519 RepID=UPI00148623C2|nr:type II toxin-antitoxin system Phd/YefM family antitoxin [Pseudoalteromonas sp. S201]
MQTLDVRDVEDDFDDMLSKIHNEHVQIVENGKRVAVMISAEEYRKCIKLFNECDSSSN